MGLVKSSIIILVYIFTLQTPFIYPNMIEISTKQFEALRLWSYKDSTGHRTVGWGHNMDTPASKKLFKELNLDYTKVYNHTLPLTEEQAQQIYDHDYEVHKEAAKALMPNFDTQPEQVQKILVDMAFNLGPVGLSKFHITLGFIRQGKYSWAADSLQRSKWYKQVGIRSKTICAALREVDRTKH